MKHEDFNILYSEIMYKERDVIEKFLKDQYDIRYGHQRDSWHLEPSVELHTTNAAIVRVTDIKLDDNKFVVFDVTSDMGHEGFWECTDFEYGELSKIIEVLPDADEIVKKNAIDDIAAELELSGNIVWTTGQKHIIGDGFDVLMVTGKGSNTEVILRKCDVNSEPIMLKNLSAIELKQLRDHINIEVLHRSNEYKELMELLSLEENMRFECHNYGDATFVIDGTDMTFDVSSLKRDDNGNLVIYGGDIDADVCDGITLTEKEIKPEYLTSIIECMKPKYSDIMDTYNAHNPELVRKINDAWKNEQYHERFGDILFALGSRDKQEIKDKFDVVIDCNETAMDNAHEIMEGVCDDWDLETILSFIRYKE
jgi:hypothetical protein